MSRVTRLDTVWRLTTRTRTGITHNPGEELSPRALYTRYDEKGSYPNDYDSSPIHLLVPPMYIPHKEVAN